MVTCDPRSESLRTCRRQLESSQRATQIALRELYLAREDLDELLILVKALGSLPGGYCFCRENRDANKSETEHTGECRDLSEFIERIDQ